VRRVPTPGGPGPPRDPRGRAARSLNGSPASRALALLRLVHPFPSLLDAVAAGALALLAGGSPATAVALALSMLGIQLAIGAVNDLADAPRDAVARPSKPIPSGAVSARTARVVAVGAAALGLALAAAADPAALAIAALGLGVGLAYDLVLKPTPLSWLPYALGIPLVPLFAWVGAVGTVPPEVLLLALLAVPAGAGVAVANALADLEEDRAAGARTVATVLGPARAWGVATTLLAGTWTVAVVALAVLGGGPAGIPAGSGAPAAAPALPGALGADAVRAAGWAAVVAAAGLLALGAALARGREPSRRRLGWGTEAIGVVALGCGWVAVAGATGGLAAG
jgi:4-hydroxybenzoate polyprenyltransferase